MVLLNRASLVKYASIGLLILGETLTPSPAQQTRQLLPVVTAGAMPLYPRDALLAHIEGIVKIKVTTDGEKVSSFDTESGPPMLARAAEQNVKTWMFEKHKPSSFVTTFTYRISDPAQCGVGNGTAILRLPLEIEVSGNEIQMCDPVVVTSSTH